LVGVCEVSPGAMPGQVLRPKRTTESSKLDIYLIAEEDIQYEEELIRSPYTLKPWLRYLQHKSDAPIHERVFVLERACRALPGSYKLWKMYLELRVGHLQDLNPAKYEEEFDKANDAFDRAVVLLNKVCSPCQLTDITDAANMDIVSNTPYEAV
jgi:pre-mRNA-splicing factor SYF1